MKCIDDEIPFEIPQTWCWVRLGSIIDFSKSSSVKPNEIEPDAWVLDLEDIEKDTGVLLAKKRMKHIQSKSDKHIFYSGNVLYSKLRPYLNKVIIADENGYCTSEILAFDFGMILNKYAQIYLMSPYFVDYAMSDAYGVKMPRLGSKQGNNALMPLPPFNEQVRIAAQLANIAPIVNRYAESQSELDRLNAEIFKRLKKSVLQESIQGKLAPQNPNDEPASVLLERIKEEKAKLFKEGKLKKKELVDSVIFKGEDNKYYEKIGSEAICIEDDIPFEIPSNWCWVRHNDLFNISGGSQPPKSAFIEYPKEGYIRLYQIRDYGPNPQPVYIPIASASKISQKGDILLARYGASLGKVFYAEDGAYNVAIAKVIPQYEGEFIYKPYIYLYYCSSIYQKEIKDRSRCAQAGFNKEDLNSLLFPLPPYNEQVRIVERYEFVIASIMSR